MAPSRMPALSLAAIPGRRATTLALAPEIERRGFAGIFLPSLGDSLSLAVSLAHATRTIQLGTSITPIYTRHVVDFAQTAAYLHEVSAGRFRFGIGVSHGPAHERLGIKPGKPLADIRQFVASLRAVPRVGELPPLVLATLRDRMVELSAEVADGLVFANGARSRMSHSLGRIGERARGDGFFVGNMTPTVISDDAAAAAERHRRTLEGYVALPNYRNYWREAGYGDEMAAAEAALLRGDGEGVRAAMSERWLRDITLYGSASSVREQLEAWFDAGVKTPILVPSSATGNQFQAFDEVFRAFS